MWAVRSVGLWEGSSVAGWVDVGKEGWVWRGSAVRGAASWSLSPLRRQRRPSTRST